MHGRSLLAAGLIVAAIMTGGCATSREEGDTRALVRLGREAAARDDWIAARRHFARALHDARLADAPAGVLAPLYFDYGRASGALCDWPEASRSLRRTRDLAGSRSRPGRDATLALARVALARGRYAEARHGFERYAALLGESTPGVTPSAYPGALIDYGRTLVALGETVRGRDFIEDAAHVPPTDVADAAATSPFGRHCVD